MSFVRTLLELKWFTDAGNALVHPSGGMAPTAERVQEVDLEGRSRLDGLFRRLTFLRKYHLAFAVVNPTIGGRIQSYSVHSCMGCQYTGKRDTYDVQTRGRLPADIPFVVSPRGDKLLCLWPFLLQRERMKSEDLRETLYVFDRIDKRAEHLARVCAVAVDNQHDGWTEKVGPERAADLVWLWTRLQEMPAIANVPEDVKLGDLLLRPHGAKLLNETLGRLSENEHERFKLTDRIGGGGYGAVYKAVRGDGREFAVKVVELKLDLGRKTAERDLRRFHQEYAVLRDVGQTFPGIIRCHTWGEDTLGGVRYCWYAMDLAKTDLGERLKSRRAELDGRLAWEVHRKAAVREFRDIARAVHELHRKGLVHRDIKPANVLIVDESAAATDDELRLADFGLIKEVARSAEVESFTTKGVGPGTEGYMAPEQEQGDRVTPRSDVFSLGVLLAELALGSPPLFRQVADGSPLEQEPRLNDLPDGLRELIVQCTRVNPHDRPESALEVQVRFAMLCNEERTP